MAHYIVSSGVTSEYLTLRSTDSMTILDGGTTWDIILRNENSSENPSGCYVDISSGGVANLTSIGAGNMYVHSGGLSYYTYFISTGGNIYIFSGGTALGTLLKPKVSMFVSSGGTANNTLISAGASMFIYAGAEVSGTRVQSGATLTFLSSAIVNDTILYGGELVASSGGIANNTIISSGVLNVSSGGEAYFTTLNTGGNVNVSSGGILSGATINGGLLAVCSRGVASNININEGGSMVIHSRGTATEVIENGGYVGITNGAKVSFSPNTFSGMELTNAVTIHSGTTANNITVKGIMEIYSGGVTNSTSVRDAGILRVYAGGVANSNLVSQSMEVYSDGCANNVYVGGGSLTIYSSGVANNIELQFRSFLNISGGSASDTLVHSTCKMFISSGGVANNTQVDGFLYVQSGGIANDTMIGSADGTSTGSMHISNGAVANNITIMNGHVDVFDLGMAKGITLNNGLIIVSSGGKIENASINNHSIQIGSGGSGSDITINKNGNLIVGGHAIDIKENGGYVDIQHCTSASFSPNIFNDVTLSRGATVHSGTTANSTTISSGGSLFVFSDGVANNTTVVNGGVLFISSGAIVNNTIIKDKGEIGIMSSGVVKNTTVDYEGVLHVRSGTTATRTTINPEGTLFVSAYGTATEIIENGGYVYIEDEANAFFASNTFSDLVLSDYVSATVHSGTTATNVLIEEDGELHVFSGGKLTGQMIFEDGAIVSVYEGGTFEFNISTLRAGAETRINNLSIIQGTPIFSLTVSVEQSGGTYMLAEYAESFDKTISVVNASGDELGTLTVGDTLSVGDADYTLNLTGDVLSVAVVRPDLIPPTISNITASTTSPTNQPIILTADFADNVGLASKQYKIGENGEWVDYTDGGVVVSENVTAFFRAIDTAGNETGANYEVTNVDTTAPVITLTGDNETPLQASTLTATVDDGSELLYSTDNETWTKYEGEIPVTGNGTFFFKATDAAGNTGTAEIVFENIQPAFALPDNLIGTPDKVSWEAATTGEEQQFIVEYSTDNFEHVIQVVTSASATDLLDLPSGTYQWRVKDENSEEWAVGEAFVSEAESDTPKVVQSNEDGNDDLFFASTNGTWENIYYAQHVGSIGDWTGTNDWVSAAGKGRIQNLFFGSSDPNVLCLTDSENGDAIFVDDVYTDSPDDMAKETSRLYKIQEIRAGAGSDIVDMTSQRFEYTGDGLTIRGGEGNDTVWANKGDNCLFGDAGDDRIVGASGNDVIVGGIGNDRMHGGGGNDVFTFCDNWGMDTVEQLEGGSVTLWFASELEGKVAWDEVSKSYTDGVNHVSVTGVASVTLKFGGTGDDAEQFAALSEMGAFDAFTSQRIFEESGKGILA